MYFARELLMILMEYVVRKFVKQCIIPAKPQASYVLIIMHNYFTETLTMLLCNI